MAKVGRRTIVFASQVEIEYLDPEVPVGNVCASPGNDDIDTPVGRGIDCPGDRRLARIGNVDDENAALLVGDNARRPAIATARHTPGVSIVDVITGRIARTSR